MKYKLDPRLKVLKDPIVQFCILVIIGLVCTMMYEKHVEKEETKPIIKQIKSDAPLSEIPRDTTEWRKGYYEHLYWN
jgi:hypothetical protein